MLNCSQPALEKLLSGLKALDYTGYAEQYPPFGSWNTFKLSRKTLSDIWRGSLSDGIETGLYVNIPFCKIKCDFCFLPVTVTGPDETAIRGEFSSYFGLLKKEAGMLANIFSSASLKTLYIGGGTPSLMTPEEIGRLFSLLHSNFHFSPKAQVTTEIHPETADISVLKAFKSGGVNWLCIGAQSLNSGVLSKAGRRQDMGAVIRAYKNARRAGIEGINIDLICGLPGQTEKSFLKDVKIIADLRPDESHLNTFIVTPYTLYGRRGGKPDAPEITERLKEKGFALLAAKGYKKLHYDSAGLKSF